MSKRSRKALPAVRVTELSDEVVTDAANDNPYARNRVAGFDPEVERLHRKIAELEEEIAKLRRDLASDEYHLTRRTRTLWTLCVGLEGKAIWGLATLPTHTTMWWANVGQAAAGGIAAGYLTWPQARVMGKLFWTWLRAQLKRSRDITLLKREERHARDTPDGGNKPGAE